MFYSQTFLARKGPLGTVWCAAHLQHKLRKSHYTSTDIPSTVDRIMNPEVPIALRMSSHLLLGVVRIYSKKVDYLYQDCNLVLVTLKNAFVYTDVNLPANATQAQFNAVTLPETYHLDALHFDDVWSSDAYQDSHVLRHEDITLADEIDDPSRGEYVTVTFDDDIIMQDIPHSGPPHDGIAPMEEDTDVPTNGDEGDQEPINSNTSPNLQVADDDASVPNTDIMNEPDNTTNVDIASHDIEEIEVIRDAVTEPNPVLVPELLDGQSKSTTSPLEHSEQIIRDRETPTLSEENVHVQEQSPLIHSLPSAFMETPDPFELNPSPGHNSPALELQPSVQPQPQPERPRARRKRRGQSFDQHPVLSNEYMKGRLDNCADIVKKRRKLPCSSLDAWRFNNRKMKEQLFLEPLVSGMCSDLKNMSESFKSNPNLVLSEETNQFPTTTQLEEAYQDTRTEQASNPVDVEHARAEEVVDPAEHLRDETYHHEASMFTDVMPSSPRIASPPSHHNINTPLSTGTAFQSIQDLGTSLRTGGSKEATPVRSLEVGDYSGDAGGSYNPAFMTSEEDELAFLEMDSHSPADSQGSGTLSARTRAVAEYLRGQTPLSSSPTEQHEDRALSLKTILHGRSRKMCARMVYETLVLSSYGLITVAQEEPREADEVYGDIKLKLNNSKVSQAQF